MITERRKYYNEDEYYKMINGDVRESDWLTKIPYTKHAIVVLEGVSMYLTNLELKNLISNIGNHFETVNLLMDCYSLFAAKMSKYKNPINDVGVTEVYGIDEPTLLESDGVSFVKEHNMTPQEFIEELIGSEKYIFRKLYAGNFSKKLYRLFEYRG